MRIITLVLIVQICCLTAMGGRYNLIDGDTAEAATVAKTEQQQRRTYVMMFSASWCKPCQDFKRRQIPRMKTSGWKFGKPGDKAAHVQIVDYDQNRGLDQIAGVTTWPTYIIYFDGRERKRLHGYITAETLAAAMKAAQR